ncbi:hypothetical protein [Moritella sp. 36]|uniref:hypothetical protein n=1 Tax=Moritella sp. 36 TaxID=2746233 RepID=UPI001BA58C49|nr:hypothetical protein [Moritella sp. 36]
MHRIRNNNVSQQIMAFFVTISLLFQIYIAATIALNPSEVLNKNWLSKLQGEKILLCTPLGFRWANVNELITQNSEGSHSAEEEHQSLQFSCQLLKAFQHSIFFAVLLICLLSVWLNRSTPRAPQYNYTSCQQKVYLSLAPKQSPPFTFYA